MYYIFWNRNLKWEKDYLKDVYDVVKGVSKFEGGCIICTRAPWLVKFFSYIPTLLVQHIAYPIICIIMFVWLSLFYGVFRLVETNEQNMIK